VAPGTRRGIYLGPTSGFSTRVKIIRLSLASFKVREARNYHFIMTESWRLFVGTHWRPTVGKKGLERITTERSNHSSETHFREVKKGVI